MPKAAKDQRAPDPISNMPQAARIGDMHTCPAMNPGPVPHVGGPVAAGFPAVLIGHQPAARVGDRCICTGPPDAIAQGSATVFIGNMPAARVGDTTAHGGNIVLGCPTVIMEVPVLVEAEPARRKRRPPSNGRWPGPPP